MYDYMDGWIDGGMKKCKTIWMEGCITHLYSSNILSSSSSISSSFSFNSSNDISSNDLPTTQISQLHVYVSSFNGTICLKLQGR